MNASYRPVVYQNGFYVREYISLEPRFMSKDLYYSALAGKATDEFLRNWGIIVPFITKYSFLGTHSLTAPRF